MNEDLIDEALPVANEMAANRGIKIDKDALMKALIAVIGSATGRTSHTRSPKLRSNFWGRIRAPQPHVVDAGHFNGSARVLEYSGWFQSTVARSFSPITSNTRYR